MQKVKLVSWTQTQNKSDLQELIAYCARVSNPSSQVSGEGSISLLRYLIKHKHWSPFEMASACLEINTTRDIAHQILRHRSFSFQEFSQRYADPNKDMRFYLGEARLQDEKNRQMSTETDDHELERVWQDKQLSVLNLAKEVYTWAAEVGIAREVRRKVLPEGLTGTRIYMAGTIRSWVHYVELRTTKGTQKEHLLVARDCAHALAPIFPMIQEFVRSG